MFSFFTGLCFECTKAARWTCRSQNKSCSAFCGAASWPSLAHIHRITQFVWCPYQFRSPLFSFVPFRSFSFGECCWMRSYESTGTDSEPIEAASCFTEVSSYTAAGKQLHLQFWGRQYGVQRAYWAVLRISLRICAVKIACNSLWT